MWMFPAPSWGKGPIRRHLAVGNPLSRKLLSACTCYSQNLTTFTIGKQWVTRSLCEPSANEKECTVPVKPLRFERWPWHTPIARGAGDGSLWISPRRPHCAPCWNGSGRPCPATLGGAAEYKYPGDQRRAGFLAPIARS